MTTATDKFQDFDTKLLTLIQKGNATYARMCAALQAEAAALAGKSKEPWRVIDRRLQALRKKGYIKPQRAGFLTVWNLSK